MALFPDKINIDLMSNKKHLNLSELISKLYFEFLQIIFKLEIGNKITSFPILWMMIWEFRKYIFDLSKSLSRIDPRKIPF